MLEVIYVSKGSKKLITGQKYIVVSLWEDIVWKNKLSISHNGKLVPRRKVRLKGGYAYYVENFKTIDGKSFYDIPVFGNKIYHYNENAVKPNNKDYS